ncbi:hypothetical protein SADUNF_Sadunf01G0152400 [Salix dunnii]|uniref:Uncharacterized protein n=1 Tax=Salix dunnii TaxID=1413687 RepID=A0A835NCH3_9ROSI|nr:hypothetical protein SADUNF_Sadunf01G0152400 [Salix dunnii]
MAKLFDFDGIKLACSRAMNWVQRKIYLYNVTFGLFMLDWWERYLFICELLNIDRYSGDRADVVRFQQWIAICHRLLQEASRVNPRYEM